MLYIASCDMNVMNAFAAEKEYLPSTFIVGKILNTSCTVVLIFEIVLSIKWRTTTEKIVQRQFK